MGGEGDCQVRPWFVAGLSVLVIAWIMLLFMNDTYLGQRLASRLKLDGHQSDLMTVTAFGAVIWIIAWGNVALWWSA